MRLRRYEMVGKVVGAQDGAAVAQVHYGHAAEHEGKGPEPLERQVEEGQEREAEDAFVTHHDAPRPQRRWRTVARDR